MIAAFSLSWLVAASCAADCRQCQEQLRTAEEEVATARGELRDVRAESESSRRETQRLQQEFDSVKFELAAIRDQRDDLREEKNALADQTLRYIEDIPRQYDEMLQDMEQRIDTEIHVCDDELRQEISLGFEESSATVEKLIAILADEFGNLDLVSDQLRREQEQLRAVRFELTKVKEEAEESRRRARLEIEDLEAELQRARRARDAAEEKNESRQADLEREIDATRGRIEIWEQTHLCRQKSTCPEALGLSRREDTEVRRFLSDMRSRVHNIWVLASNY